MPFFLEDVALEGEGLDQFVDVRVSAENGTLGDGGAAWDTSTNNATVRYQGSAEDIDFSGISYTSLRNSEGTDQLTFRILDGDGNELQTFTKTISVGELFDTAGDFDGSTLEGTGQNDGFGADLADVDVATEVDGAAGFDRFFVGAVDADAALDATDFTTVNVEHVDLALADAADTATVDAGMFDGVQLISAFAAAATSANALTINDLNPETAVQIDDNIVDVALGLAEGDSLSVVLAESADELASVADAGDSEAAVENLTLDVRENADFDFTMTDLVNVTAAGAGNLMLTGAALDTVANGFTLDADGLEGDLSVELTGNRPEEVSLTGGEGVNTFTFGANLTNDDTIVGGDLNEAEDNQDVLTATVSGETNAFDISKVEEITFTMADEDVTIDSAGISGADFIAVAETGTDNTFTLENVESGTEVELTALAATNTVHVDGATGDSEVFFTVTDGTVGTLQTTNIETVNIETSTGGGTLAEVATSGANSLVVTGDQSLEVTERLNSEIDSIDLTEFEAAFTATVADGSNIQVGEEGSHVITLAGGALEGEDTIQFAYDGTEGDADFADQAIDGFNVSDDAFNFSSLDITADDLTWADVEDDTDLTVDTGDESFTVFLVGVNEADFSADNFVF